MIRKSLLDQPALRAALQEWLRDTRRTSLIARMCVGQSVTADEADSTWNAQSLAIAEAFDVARALVCERLGIKEDDNATTDGT